ncbi:MAG TPA: helix-turn-helix domain-containing protein [Patescibacteria group bacterium]
MKKKKVSKKIIVTNQVAKFRQSLRLRPSVLAARIGISRYTLYKIEKGKVVPILLIALKLAQYFDTSVDTLFKLETDFEFYESVRTLNKRQS